MRSSRSKSKGILHSLTCGLLGSTRDEIEFPSGPLFNTTANSAIETPTAYRTAFLTSLSATADAEEDPSNLKLKRGAFIDSVSVEDLKDIKKFFLGDEDDEQTLADIDEIAERMMRPDDDEGDSSNRSALEIYWERSMENAIGHYLSAPSKRCQDVALSIIGLIVGISLRSGRPSHSMMRTMGQFALAKNTPKYIPEYISKDTFKAYSPNELPNSLQSGNPDYDTKQFRLWKVVFEPLQTSTDRKSRLHAVVDNIITNHSEYPFAPWTVQNCYEWLNSGRDIIWTEDEVRNATDEDYSEANETDQDRRQYNASCKFVEVLNKLDDMMRAIGGSEE